jgi:hypothetical protein
MILGGKSIVMAMDFAELERRMLSFVKHTNYIIIDELSRFTQVSRPTPVKATGAFWYPTSGVRQCLPPPRRTHAPSGVRPAHGGKTDYG